ncbi:MAG TPA: hypothetical protein VN581_13435 [Patescibacteria group bacterium]|nr:hypothetical protein [Patescibacteria group bacterium]
MYRHCALLFTLLVASATTLAEAWPMHDVRTQLSFNAALMRDLGLKVDRAAKAHANFPGHALSLRFDDPIAFSGRPDKRVRADIEGHVFEHLLGPGVRHRGGFELSWRDGRLSMRDFVLAPAYAPREFEIRSHDGLVVFRADYAHFEVDAERGDLKLFNLDLKIGADLAARMNAPELDGVVIGGLEVSARLDVPPGTAKLGTPPSCSDWSGEQDVALIGIGSVGQWQRGNGLVAISPSATLKNVGTANVPWYAKFTGTFPPYGNDQHPYLIWGIYRIKDGRIEQIGASAVKHAFLTTNTGCDAGACTGSGAPGGSGHILGLGCQDTYSQGNNNSTGALSFRSEIQSALGLWNHTGSHFDQNGDGIQDHSGVGETFLDHGANVLEADLQTADSSYYLDAWYVVRDDIDIFNTMGWRQITPSFNGAIWTFATPTPLVNGPAVNAWVSDTAPSPGTRNTLLTQPDGHLRVVVSTTDLGGGLTRYEYAVVNHDFDRQIGTFSIPTGGATLSDLYFHDIDRDAGSDWTATQDASAITWTKPANAEGLDWGTLYNFGFTATTPPRNGFAAMAAVAPGSPSQLAASTLVPDVEGLLFRNDFE